MSDSCRSAFKVVEPKLDDDLFSMEKVLMRAKMSVIGKFFVLLVLCERMGKMKNDGHQGASSVEGA